MPLIVVGLWPRAISVEVTTVSRGPLVVTVDEEGMTRVKNRYVVSAPVAGQLRRIDWKAGAVIEAGRTVLAVLEGLVNKFLFDVALGSSPILSGDTLFGVSYQGGTDGGGNVFRINTDGLQYTNLYSFPRQSGANTSGSNPYDFAGLVLSGNKLYGTTSVSGIGGQGTVFELNTDGTGFTVLHSFQYTDGGHPEPLVLSGGTLYGMTSYGFQGISLGDGGVFALVLQPTLNLALASNLAVLTWNDPSFFLYSSPTITNVFTKMTGASSPYTNTVTGVIGR
jgi:uncharacterized repeat protein (TIGR03803 family)